jgi:hypothetical protein
MQPESGKECSETGIIIFVSQRSYLINKDVLSLSGEDLIELIKAVHEKQASFKFPAKGFSMSPFVKDGDIITIAPGQNSSARLGDIVAFIHPVAGRLVVHRVVKKEGSHVRIRGDSGQSDDGLIPESAILGRITEVERDGEKVYLGLGVERHLIARLSGRELLSRILFRLSSLRNAIRSCIKKMLP